jgi:ATP-binding cassette subfamily B (MDR/TAP) protein 1
MDVPSGGVPPAKEPLEDAAQAQASENTDSTTAPATEPEKRRDQVSVSGSTATSGGAKEKVPGTKQAALQDASDQDAAFAHLPEQEKQILKTQLDSPPVKVTFFSLYRYADAWDWLIIFIGAICAIAAGAALPLFTVSSDITSRLAGSPLSLTSMYRSFSVS